MGKLYYYLRPMRFIVKNSPSLKFCFDLPLYYTAASRTSNLNSSANTKLNCKLLYVMYGTGAQVGLIVKKTRSKKSRATVPLSRKRNIVCFVGFIQLSSRSELKI
jgi:hypothetical protein